MWGVRQSMREDSRWLLWQERYKNRSCPGNLPYHEEAQPQEQPFHGRLPLRLRCGARNQNPAGFLSILDDWVGDHSIGFVLGLRVSLMHKLFPGAATALRLPGYKIINQYVALFAAVTPTENLPVPLPGIIRQEHPVPETHACC